MKRSEVIREHLADLAWTLRRSASQLGYVGALSLVLFAAAAWLHYVEVPKLDAGNQQLEEEVASLQMQLAQPITAARATSPIDLLREELEPQERLAAVIDDLGAQLTANGAMLVEATFGVPSWKDTPTIGRVDVVVSARGPYAALKMSFGELLNRHPGLGLEQLTLEKVEPASATLEARLKLIYLFKR